MNNIALLPTIRAQRCGACSFLDVKCLTNCFWAPYIKRGEEEKFSLLVEDTSVEIFKAKVKKCGIDRRQNYIDNQYKNKMEMKSEQAVLAAESLNQHEGIAVVDVAEHSLNHHEGEVVHDFGTGLETRKRVRTPLSTKSCSNVAKDSLNHCEWPVKRVRTPQPTKSRFFFWTPIPLAENAVGPSEKVVPLAEKAVDRSDNALLLLARGTEIIEFTDMFSEEDRTKILELKKQHDNIWLQIMVSKIVNDMVQESEQAMKEQASLRNEKAEQSEKEQASLRNETAEQAEKEQAKRSEK